MTIPFAWLLVLPLMIDLALRAGILGTLGSKILNSVPRIWYENDCSDESTMLLVYRQMGMNYGIGSLIMSGESSRGQRSPAFLRISLGLLFFYFGFLKFYPDLSPAELIAGQTLMRLLLNWSEVRATLAVLAILECGIGAALVLNLLPRTTFVLFLIHMAGTFLPLFLLPEFTFKIAPFAPTLEGQYILKNLVFVAAAWTVLRPEKFSKAGGATPVGESAIDEKVKSDRGSS